MAKMSLLGAFLVGGKKAEGCRPVYNPVRMDLTMGNKDRAKNEHRAG
jgi:hypothetical protein